MSACVYVSAFHTFRTCHLSEDVFFFSSPSRSWECLCFKLISKLCWSWDTRRGALYLKRILDAKTSVFSVRKSKKFKKKSFGLYFMWTNDDPHSVLLAQRGLQIYTFIILVKIFLFQNSETGHFQTYQRRYMSQEKSIIAFSLNFFFISLPARMDWCVLT